MSGPTVRGVRRVRRRFVAASTGIGIGLRLLDLQRVPVASYLPALVLAPVLVGLFAR